MPSIGGPELIFLLVIVLVVFGAGRLPEVFGQVGKGVRAFRDESTKTEAAPPPARPANCAGCSTPLQLDAKFCAQCGKATQT